MSRRIVVLFGAFILLGLPEGVLGTAWPSMRADFNRPEAALAQLLIAYTIGYLVSSASMGQLADRFGPATTVIGLAATTAGLAGYGLSPMWGFTLGAGATDGVGAGIVDASINAEVALRHGQRTMNLLHAAFGVGATLGPLFMTALLAAEIGWRAAFVVLLVAEVAILVALRTAGSESGLDQHDRGESSTARYAPRAARPRLVLGVSLVYFAAYVAAEVSIGQWSYSILTEGRNMAEAPAGLAVAAYWAGLTAGRLALGAIGDRLHPMRLLRGAAGLAVAATIWFSLDTVGSALALPVIGLAFAGIFPALVLMTSSWLPADLVARAVGFQLAASSGGAILAAVVVGVIADRRGLEATVGAMLALVIVLVGTQVGIERAARLSGRAPQ